MTTQQHPAAHGEQHPTPRIVYGILLTLVVAALLIFALRYAFPNGSAGIDRDPEETGTPGQTDGR
jgi:hypothetical protein